MYYYKAINKETGNIVRDKMTSKEFQYFLGKNDWSKYEFKVIDFNDKWELKHFAAFGFCFISLGVLLLELLVRI